VTVETDIRTRIVADGTISGLVATRVYPLVLPQKPTYPAIRYGRISGPRSQLLDGPSEWGFARVEYDSWATSYTGAQTLAAAVRSSLNGFIGTLSGRSVVIRLENERDDFEEADELYRVIQDYIVLHEN